MSDLSDRDRVTAILTLAEAAAPAPWLMGRVTADGSVSVRAPSPNSPSGESDVAYDVWQEDAYFIAASRSETPWLARRLLEALDAIDKARDLHYDDNGDCHECDLPAPCLTVRLLALNGGNE